MTRGWRPRTTAASLRATRGALAGPPDTGTDARPRAPGVARARSRRPGAARARPRAAPAPPWRGSRPCPGSRPGWAPARRPRSGRPAGRCHRRRARPAPPWPARRPASGGASPAGIAQASTPLARHHARACSRSRGEAAWVGLYAKPMRFTGTPSPPRRPARGAPGGGGRTRGCPTARRATTRPRRGTSGRGPLRARGHAPRRRAAPSDRARPREAPAGGPARTAA